MFIIKGYAGTGKTTVLNSLVGAHRQGKRKIVLMAPTGRAAKVMSASAHYPAHTVHRTIYRPKVGASGLATFSLSTNPLTNTTFIVDEAGLVGNKSDIGSNSLLEDILEFVFSNSNNSLILMGDPAQLPPVGEEISPALSEDYFNHIAGIPAKSIELKQVVRQALDSTVLKNATALRNLITSGSNDAPTLEPGPDIIRVEDGYQLQEIFEHMYSGSDSSQSTMVVRSNKKANGYNQGIRSRIKYHEDQIAAGDEIMVVKNNYFWLPEDSKMSFIANGEIARIRSIRKIHERYGFTFCEATIDFVDTPAQESIDVLLNLSVLDSPGPSLSGPQSQEFYQKMLEKYAYLGSKKKIYEGIKCDPYYNALQVKFSYVITCHKAQGGQWDTVIVEHPYLPNGPSNIYSKWLYTAITRAAKKVYLVGFPDEWFGPVSLEDKPES